MIKEYVDTILEMERAEGKCTQHKLSNKSKEIVLLPFIQQLAYLEKKVTREYIDSLGFDSSGSIYHTEKWPGFSIEIYGASNDAVDFYLRIHIHNKLDRDDYIEFIMKLMKKEKIQSWISSNNTLFCTYVFKKKNRIEKWFNKKIKEAMDCGIRKVVADVTIQRFIYEAKGKSKQ